MAHLCRFGRRPRHIGRAAQPPGRHADEADRVVRLPHGIIELGSFILLQLGGAAFVGAHTPVGDDELTQDIQRRQIYPHGTAWAAVVAKEVHRHADGAACAPSAQLDVGQTLGLIGVGNVGK
ncbi:hypothetical protein D3C76_910130 [compost metagenome]